MVDYSFNALRDLTRAPIANPAEAMFQGAQGGNYLYKVGQGRQADELTPAAMAGDKNALAKLAGVDYARASKIDDTAYDRKRQGVADGRAAAAESRAAAAESRTAADWARKDQAGKIEDVSRVIFSADTPEKFEVAKGMLKARGIDPTNLKFEERDTYLAQARSLSDQVAAGKPIEVSAGASLMKPSGEVLGTAPPNPGAGKPTEAAVRNGQLFSVAAPELGIVNQTFGSLADPTNQIIGKAGLPGNLVASAPYQRARGAISTIIATYLYSVSGATANPGEVANQTEILTPKLGDKADVIRDKLERVNRMVNSIKIGARGATSEVDGAPPPVGGQAGAAPGGGALKPGQYEWTPQGLRPMQ